MLTLVLSSLISLLIVEKYRSNYNFNSLNIVKSNKESLNQENYLKTSYQKIFNIITKRFVGIDSVLMLSSKKKFKF